MEFTMQAVRYAIYFSQTSNTIVEDYQNDEEYNPKPSVNFI